MAQIEEIKEEEHRVNKWDGQTVKNTLDDIVKKLINENLPFKERFTLADGRLLISTVAVGFALFALVYDFYNPFPKSKVILAVCALSYFALMGILQFYLWYVEKNIFYQAMEKDGKTKERYWRWASEMKRYDDKYTLTASFSEGESYAKVSITKSIGCYITDDGLILLPALKKEIQELYKRALKDSEHAK